MPGGKILNKLRQIILAEIASCGVMTFARFMELSLYCPHFGYYERKRDTVGRQGDFYTNVSIGPLFGELLAFQFAGWLETLNPQPSTLNLVEAGAHDGKLAADILNWMRIHRTDLFSQLEYVIIEPSEYRRQWQQETLSEFISCVKWLAELPDNPKLHGILFCNELLDAMPFHRLGWDSAAKVWFEWGVSTNGDQFIWARLPNPGFRVPDSGLEDVFPDGYTIEICPAAEIWWRAAARSLAVGKLVAIDYGNTASGIFRPERHRGTLRAYYRHQVSGDLLANVGQQDLTAHVNFTALQWAGETEGLRTEGLFPQSRFLTQIAGQAWNSPVIFGEWTPAHTRQFHTLTHPEHLGRAFQVLVQSH